MDLYPSSPIMSGVQSQKERSVMQRARGYLADIALNTHTRSNRANMLAAGDVHRFAKTIRRL